MKTLLIIAVIGMGSWMLAIPQTIMCEADNGFMGSNAFGLKGCFDKDTRKIKWTY